MEDWKKEYDNIKVPEEMREKLEQSINRAKKEKKANHICWHSMTERK